MPLSSRTVPLPARLGWPAALLATLLLWSTAQLPALTAQVPTIEWDELPQLPDPLGVAGPFAGAHGGVLIVAGGANFPEPVWENPKAWRDSIYVLEEADGKPRWLNAGSLPTSIAYGASATTPLGVVCVGGNHGEQTFRQAFLLRWQADSQRVRRIELPDLPQACAYAAATYCGTSVYVAGGQSTSELNSAMRNFWRLDLDSWSDETARTRPPLQWERLPAWPGPARAFNLTLSQIRGEQEFVYVISGRRQSEPQRDAAVEFLRDAWEFEVASGRWRRLAELPQCSMAGVGAAWGPEHLMVFSGATGELFFQSDQLRDQHPGFPPRALLYDTRADRWSEAGATPANHVTTVAVPWGDSFVIPSGEIRPRVRTPRVLQARPATAVQHP